MGRVATLILVVTVACSSSGNGGARGRESTRVEAGIERELGTRVGVAVRVRCVWIAPRCRATLPDGTTLGIRLMVEHGAVMWRLEGGLVLADDLEAYLRDQLADLGAPQVARCGVRIRSVTAGERVQCQLQHGGKAFASIGPDGALSVEIVLDPVAGDARSEVVTTERDAVLLQMSRKLEHADGDEEE